MNSGTLLNIGLVLLFILIGGVFAGTEIALVSLRESQLDQLGKRGRRGRRVAAVARDPNRFLAAVQIGVTVAGFFSAAYGASTIAPDFAPVFEDLGMSTGLADTVALIALTLLIAYGSLVVGELVPKRIALQRSSATALVVTPTLDRFAALMRPVIWLLSVSTNAIVRLLGLDPSQANEDMSEEELRELVSAHESLPDVKRALLRDAFEAADRTLGEVMRPRHNVVFLEADMTLDDAIATVAREPYSRYPVKDGDVDSIVGFIHVRDLFLVGERTPDSPEPPRLVRDLTREVVVFPRSNALLPSMAHMQWARTHLAIVIDEYGGTDGIVTLEDLVEELVGDIKDEYDDVDEIDPGRLPAELPVDVPGGMPLDDLAEHFGIELPHGPYETIGGLVLDLLDRTAEPGDAVVIEPPTSDEDDGDDGDDDSAGPQSAERNSHRAHIMTVVAVDGHRIVTVRLDEDDDMA